MKLGMNSSEMQKNNRLLVFQTLLACGSMNRKELAEKLQLQKTTITNIINEFYSFHIVAVDGDSASGRRSEKITLMLDGLYTMSIAINRKEFQFSIFSLDGRQQKHTRYRFTGREDIFQIVEMIKTQGRKLLAEYGSERILGISLAVPGLFVNRPEFNEEIFMVSEFEDLGKVDIHRELERAFRKKIYIKHDAKLSAYAEWRCSEEAAENENVSLAVIRSRGYGVGAGFVINGRIVNGHLGLAGEAGYMGINYNRCRGENRRAGDFEYCAGTESVVRYVRERLIDFPESRLTEDSTYQEIFEAYRDGEELATWAVERMAWMLGYGISNIIYLLNPDCIILGPDYPQTERFLQKVKSAIRERVPNYVEECTKIRYSKLNEESFLLGGYYHVINKLCTEEDIFALIRNARGEELTD